MTKINSATAIMPPRCRIDKPSGTWFEIWHVEGRLCAIFKGLQWPTQPLNPTYKSMAEARYYMSWLFDELESHTLLFPDDWEPFSVMEYIQLG